MDHPRKSMGKKSAALDPFMQRIATYDPNRDLWTFKFPDVSGVTVQMLAEELVKSGPSNEGMTLGDAQALARSKLKWTEWKFYMPEWR